MRRLDYTYGCSGCVSVDADGYLQVNTAGLSQAVITATQFLTDSINSTTWYAEVEVARTSEERSKVAFGQTRRNQGTVKTGPNAYKSADALIVLDFSDDQYVSGPQQEKETFLFLVFAHEVAHEYPAGREDPDATGKTGPVVDAVNEIQLARGLPLRARYALSSRGTYWLDVPYGNAAMDKNHNVQRDTKTKAIKVNPTNRSVFWLKQNVGGTGVN